MNTINSMGMKNSQNKIKQKRPLKKNLPEIDINLKQTKNMCLALSSHGLSLQA